MKCSIKSFIGVGTCALTLLVAGCVAPQPSNVNMTNSNSSIAATQQTPDAMSNMNHGNMNHQDTSHSMMDHANMKSSPDAARQPYDLQFIDTMTAHHQGAIEMARPAATKAQHSELKELARQIIEDQEREVAEMRRYREQWFVGRPPAVNMEMPGMLDSMKGMDMTKMNAATGNEFDLMFIDMMTPHHVGAVVMAKEALIKAEHAEIKRLAQAIIAAQEKEIAQMGKWKGSWR